MAIDRKKAIEQLSQVKVKGGDDGLISAFGVLIQFMPTNFWNTFTEKILKSVHGDEDQTKEVEEGLEVAAAECGYHTGWGIINSDEFKTIIMPMVEKQPEDILHGAFAVLSAWGWGDTEIIELIPETKMVIRAYGYYEAEISDTFDAKRPVAYMLRGICRAFMDIAYGSPYPKGFNTFVCEQTKAIENGDDVGEFVIKRRTKES